MPSSRNALVGVFPSYLLIYFEVASHPARRRSISSTLPQPQHILRTVLQRVWVRPSVLKLQGKGEGCRCRWRQIWRLCSALKKTRAFGALLEPDAAATHSTRTSQYESTLAINTSQHTPRVPKYYFSGQVCPNF